MASRYPDLPPSLHEFNLVIWKLINLFSYDSDFHTSPPIPIATASTTASAAEAWSTISTSCPDFLSPPAPRQSRSDPLTKPRFPRHCSALERSATPHHLRSRAWGWVSQSSLWPFLERAPSAPWPVSAGNSPNPSLFPHHCTFIYALLLYSSKSLLLLSDQLELTVPIARP